MRRTAIICLLALGAIAGSAPAAQAALRSPPLESSCSDGFSYGEITAGPWRVEGCHRAGAEQGLESRHERFRGKVELNGLVVEGDRELVVTTSGTANRATQGNRAREAITGSGDFPEHEVHRPGARLVLDPLVGGQRRRIVIYSGAVNFSLRTADPVSPGTAFATDIPVGSNVGILGMRLRDRLRNAEVVRGGGGTPGSIKFKAPLSLGSGASALLRDWIGRTKIELRDGQGMRLDGVRFKVPSIVIPGVGGFDDFDVSYNGGRDEWIGGAKLLLGELFPSLDFQVNVSASTGIPTRIEANVGNLSIPIGNTGIVLRELRGLFQQNPLIFGAGLTATAGPSFGPFSLIEMSGDIEVRLEPTFRLEIDGNARVFPTGANSEIARGTARFVLDSSGFISVAAEARYSLLVAGIGASATAGGSGAYSTTGNRFNIQAHVSGMIHAGFLGDFEVARLEAVVSDEGWGACGKLALFIEAGVGQEWGRNPDVFLNCNLGRYRSPVGGSSAAAGTRPFTVREGTKMVGIEITGAGPEPRAAVVGPGGQIAATTFPLGRRDIGDSASVIAQPGEARQLVVLNNPAPGRWRVAWGNEGPEVTGIRIARDIDPVAADVSVARVKGRPGIRRMRLRRLRGLVDGERLVIGVRTPRGIVPLRDAATGAFDETFDELDPGRREIVAIVYRDGIPNPSRTRTIGFYDAKLPGRARRLVARRRKDKAVLLAKTAKGAEAPDAWQYILFTRLRPFAAKRARPGKIVRIPIPKGTPRVTAAVRPVLNGRPLTGKARVKRIR